MYVTVNTPHFDTFQGSKETHITAHNHRTWSVRAESIKIHQSSVNQPIVYAFGNWL